MPFDVNAPRKSMVKPWFLVENCSRIEMDQLLHAAGFVAIFIEANYLTVERTNAIFYRGISHVMPQGLAL